MKLLFFIVSWALLLQTSSWAAPFSNIGSLKSSLGFNKHYPSPSVRPLKVAIFDKGFYGYEVEVGRSLPASTVYVPGPVKSPDLQVDHGLRMAQILTSLMTDDLRASQFAPELTLYNVYGFSNFKAAVDDVIKRKFDIVLYSEVWEYGGNFDGRGFINAEVNRATSAGIIWVNAAGNFALTTYNGSIRTLHDDWVQLPNQNNSLLIRCENRSGKCPVKIVLSWNDFKDDVNLGTNKDLDLALTDDLLNIVQTSALKQSTDANESRPGYSKYPREIITAELTTGNYFLRVKNRSKNFTAQDQLRITVDGEVIMPSRTAHETLLNPADNPSVITVGASDSDRSSSSAKLGKPDLFAPSSLILPGVGEYRGSSNSAAIVAAGLGILKARNPHLTRNELLKAVTFSGGNWNETGLSLNLLGFRPTGPGCFIDVIFNPLPTYLEDVVSRGGVLVQTTAGVRVMVPFDPVVLTPGQERRLLNDMIVALPQGGYAIYPRHALIPNGAAEVFQRPMEAGLCRAPISRGGGKNFHL